LATTRVKIHSSFKYFIIHGWSSDAADGTVGPQVRPDDPATPAEAAKPSHNS